MYWHITSGRNSGKTHYAWQYVLADARKHLLETGQPHTTLVVGMFPGKPELQAKITFEIVKLPEAPRDRFIRADRESREDAAKP